MIRASYSYAWAVNRLKQRAEIAKEERKGREKRKTSRVSSEVGGARKRGTERIFSLTGKECLRFPKKIEKTQ